MVRKFVSVPPSQRLTTKKLTESHGLFLDDFLGLPLGADHENVSAARDGLDHESVCAHAKDALSGRGR